MRKANKQTGSTPFGSKLLGIVAILLGVFEGYFTWSMVFDFRNFVLPYDVSSFIDITSTLLFFLTTIAEIGLGITLIVLPYKDKQKNKYERILITTIFCIALNIALGFLGIINGISVLMKLQG